MIRYVHFEDLGPGDCFEHEGHWFEKVTAQSGQRIGPSSPELRAFRPADLVAVDDSRLYLVNEHTIGRKGLVVGRVWLVGEYFIAHAGSGAVILRGFRARAHAYHCAGHVAFVEDWTRPLDELRERAASIYERIDALAASIAADWASRHSTGGRSPDGAAAVALPTGAPPPRFEGGRSEHPKFDRGQ